MNNLVSILEAAIKSKTSLTIIYQGGSHPGDARRIYPVALREGLLKARDVESGQSKSYKLELIRLPDAEWVEDAEPGFRHYHSLYNLLLLEQALIMRSGLFMEADRYHIQLFRSERDIAFGAPVFSIAYQRGPEAASGKSGGSRQGVKAGTWVFNGEPQRDLQQAAQAFVAALREYVRRE